MSYSGDAYPLSFRAQSQPPRIPVNQLPPAFLSFLPGLAPPIKKAQGSASPAPFLIFRYGSRLSCICAVLALRPLYRYTITDAATTSAPPASEVGLIPSPRKRNPSTMENGMPA